MTWSQKIVLKNKIIPFYVKSSQMLKKEITKQLVLLQFALL